MSRKACSRRPYSPQQPTDVGPFKQATAARPATPASCTARLAASGDARTDIIAPRDGLSAISRPRLRSHHWCLNVVQKAVRAWRSAGRAYDRTIVVSMSCRGLCEPGDQPAAPTIAPLLSQCRAEGCARLAISRPRSHTRAAAVAQSSAPEKTAATYSPSEWPEHSVATRLRLLLLLIVITPPERVA